ncbi:hypothetical protein ACGFY7_23300 [Streptomyces prunicolor]|uniref:hypothetical protein n=1 Tax=Streptomyces prunicolor TaxID=67348 RepID=UPI00371E1584
MTDSIIVRVSLDSYDMASTGRQTQVYVQVPEVARASWLLPSDHFHGLKDRAWPEVLDVVNDYILHGGIASNSSSTAAWNSIWKWLAEDANRDEMQAAFEEREARRHPASRDPLVVNTRDGVVWLRRAVTAEGRGLYAVTGSCSCPEFLMATLAELAAHGIAGSADVLPMPVSPARTALDLDAIVARALRLASQYAMPDETDQDDLDRLTDFDVPELVAEVRGLRIKASQAREEIANHQPVLAALDRARARVAELEAGIAWRDAERERWADVHAIVERAIDKGSSVIYTDQLECELGPEPAAPGAVETGGAE